MGHLDKRFTKSLLHFEGANAGTVFTDESGKVWTPTSATTSTTQNKFGTTAGSFQGTGFISTPQSSDFDFGNGDFTIDMWLYITAVGQANNSTVIIKAANATVYSPFELVFLSGGYALKLLLSSTGSSWDLANQVTVGTITASTWTHVAVSRKSTNVYAFMSGVLGSTTAVSTNSLYSTSATTLVGGGNYTNTYITGYIDELRVSKGFGYYQTAFNVPTKPFMPPQPIIVQ